MADRELYLKHRPKRFKDMVGQEDAIKVLTGFVKNGNVPHVILFSGEPGTGKTTAARILKDKLGCDDGDFEERNCAKEGGIDVVRTISEQMTMFAMAGKDRPRVWLLDEFARATIPAQESLLKVLEDTPDHVYFFLATTAPDKVIRALRTRCTPIVTRLLSGEEMTGLVRGVAAKEGKEVPDAVVERIVEAAEGSPRMALVHLNAVINLPTEKEQCDAIVSPEVQKQGRDLCEALLKRSKWAKVAVLLRQVEKEDPEGIRRQVMGWARNKLLTSVNDKGACVRAAQVLDCFKGNFFEAGNGGLALACWEVSVQD
jgi:DNA polymerase III gamma/tau subunit